MKKLTLSYTAIQDLIIEPEVSSKENYEKELITPTWPGGTSGVTIGLGYDIGMSSPAQIQRDWTGILLPAQIEELKKYSGKIGRICKSFLPIKIRISWDQATLSFYRTSLLTHAKAAANVYPELETLHPYEQTAIIGLVYNRGSALKGERRTEMLQLVQAIKDDNDKLMGSIIRQMKRLWEGQNMNGLLRRRDLEAQYIEKVDLSLPESDLLYLTV